MSKSQKRKTVPKPKAKAKAKAAKKTTPRPKAQTLPGMEQVRHVKLDRHCEAIAEMREELNEIRGNESKVCQSALVYMHDNKVTTYRFAGVELARVPGEEKLRVRTTKQVATLENEDDTETEGTGQGPAAVPVAEPEDTEPF